MEIRNIRRSRNSSHDNWRLQKGQMISTVVECLQGIQMAKKAAD
jgi:hypothetical protein